MVLTEEPDSCLLMVSARAQLMMLLLLMMVALPIFARLRQSTVDCVVVARRTERSEKNGLVVFSTSVRAVTCTARPRWVLVIFPTPHS